MFRALDLRQSESLFGHQLCESDNIIILTLSTFYSEEGDRVVIIHFVQLHMYVIWPHDNKWYRDETYTTTIMC